MYHFCDEEDITGSFEIRRANIDSEKYWQW